MSEKYMREEAFYLTSGGVKPIYIICSKLYSKFIYKMDLNIRLKTIKTDGEKQVKHQD